MDLERVVSRSGLAADLRALGVEPGDVVMTHESVRAIGWVVGGPAEVGEALLGALGPGGTWMKYVGSEDSGYAVEGLPPEVQALYRRDLPPFDPAHTRACRGWGVLTEYLRTWPGARRSSHPDGSFAAVGRLAGWLMAPHPLQDGLGPGSPLERLVAAGGKVLLLGAPYETTTLLHYAEYLAPLPNKARVRYQTPVLGGDGEVAWVPVEELDSSEGIADFGEGDPFERIVAAFVEGGHARCGRVGHASSVLMDGAQLVEFGVEWMVRHHQGGRR